VSGEAVPSYELCALTDIEDGGSAGFGIEMHDKKIGIMAIRQGDMVYTYLNSCPHIGTPLDFKPGQFLDIAREHILCSTHAALFRIEDGHCISGPCAGLGLKPVINEIVNGRIYLSL